MRPIVYIPLLTMQLPMFLSEVTNLHVPRNIDRFRYDNRGRSFVYGIMCHATGMIYVGST